MALFDDTAKYTKSFTDAHEFLEALRTSSTEWGTGWQSDWIFRGQRNADWGLIPSAHRESTIEKLKFIRNHLTIQHSKSLRDSVDDDPARSRNYAIEAMQSAVELSIIMQFAQGANDSGLVTPDIRGSFAVESVLPGGLPMPKLYSDLIRLNFDLFALAQHHGIPTRLLDWTETAWNAAFFAANDCFVYFTTTPNPKPISHIAVWAAKRLSLRKLEIPVEESNRAGNAYLRAQRGMFTWDPYCGYDFVDHGHRRGLEQKLVNIADDYQSIRKFTLEIEQVPKLIRLLFRERIAHHAMMPSYDAAAAGALSYDMVSAAEATESWFANPQFLVSPD